MSPSLAPGCPRSCIGLDVDKTAARDARILEHLYIVGDVHRSEHVVGVVDKPRETLARPCGQEVVVDEDVVAHAHLGDGDLGTRPSMSAGALEVEPDHLVLLLGKQQLHDMDGVLHTDRVVGVHDRELHEPSVGVHHRTQCELLLVVGSRSERHWSRAGYPLRICRGGCASCNGGARSKG